MTKETVTYICQSCQHRFTIDYDGWYPRKPCQRCGKTALMDSMVDHRGGSFAVKKYIDVTGFGHDRLTGKPVWIDTKGKRIDHDDSRIRYNLHNDPHGWRATGKRVRQYDSHGRENY